MKVVSPDKACVHTFDRSIEFCGCGKVRSSEMSREVKVIKKADREQQSIVVPEQSHAILSGDEIVRRYMEVRRAMKALESCLRSQGLDLKPE